jgi:YgiT-type zinc finger domain-containing protein
LLLEISQKRDELTMATEWQETLVEKQVTYTLNLNGQVILIENVPARVDEETGEQFFSPPTVEHLQQTILNEQEPDHFVQVPVYKYSNGAA